MQKRKPVWNAPMLNQPTVFEAAHIEYIEINGFAASYLFTSCSHSNPNFVAGLNIFLDAELQPFNA
jgi:hypothetical protein